MKVNNNLNFPTFDCNLISCKSSPKFNEFASNYVWTLNSHRNESKKQEKENNTKEKINIELSDFEIPNNNTNTKNKEKKPKKTKNYKNFKNNKENKENKENYLKQIQKNSNNKPKIPLYLRNVKSKIKEQVNYDKKKQTQKIEEISNGSETFTSSELKKFFEDNSENNSNSNKNSYKTFSEIEDKNNKDIYSDSKMDISELEDQKQKEYVAYIKALESRNKENKINPNYSMHNRTFSQNLSMISKNSNNLLSCSNNFFENAYPINKKNNEYFNKNFENLANNAEELSENRKNLSLSLSKNTSHDNILDIANSFLNSPIMQQLGNEHENKNSANIQKINNTNNINFNNFSSGNSEMFDSIYRNPWETERNKPILSNKESKIENYEDNNESLSSSTFSFFIVNEDLKGFYQKEFKPILN